jgi:alpha-beta hydrolase superfamily lysophospholipase
MKGHGLSSGVRGHVESFDDYCWDVLKLVKLVEEESDRPILLLGHGMGALILLKMMNPISAFYDDLKGSVRGLIFINPLLHFNFTWPEVKIGKFKQWLPTIDRIKIPVRLKGHQLCTDTDAADQFDRDPLILRKLSLGCIGEVIQAGVDVRRMSYFIDHPSLFLISQDDFFISPEQIILYQKGLPKEASRFHVYTEAKHDLLNDRNRELVFNDIINWIEELRP